VAQQNAAKVSDVEFVVQNMVDALAAVGVPACATVLVSDDKGEEVRGPTVR
jgi:hypothetical protein